MTPRKLTVLSLADAPVPGDPSGSACSRRDLLKALGCLTVAGLPLASFGCSASGSQLGNASTTMCGANLCLDLGNAANAELTRTGGAMVVDAPNGDTLVLIRSAADSVLALSAVCTHRGCIIDFDSSRNILQCPCHGSEFSENGSVIRGPAGRPLTTYRATLSGQQVSVTL